MIANVDTEKITVAAFHHILATGRYELLSAASVQEGTLTSTVLPGLFLDLAGLFSE